MKSIRVQGVVMASLALLFAASVVAASDDDVRDQQEKQRQIQGETDHVVKRITTMLRVMQFYEIASPEKKIMEEMSGTLAGLSKNQMENVIRQLETAAVAKDEKQSDEAYEKAYDNHRKVLNSLHEMVARHDAIKSLEQAADRFDKQAKKELELHEQSRQPIRDLIESSKPDLSPTSRLLLAKRMKAHAAEMKRQSDNQSDVARDVRILLKQVKELPSLSAEAQERVKAMGQRVRETRVDENLKIASDKLAVKGFANIRIEQFQAASDLQRQNAGQPARIGPHLARPV